MSGLSVDALYPPGLVADRRAMRAVIDAGQRLVVETEHITGCGQRFPVQLDCSVLRDAQSQPESVIVYARDLSAERQATRERQLAAAAFEVAQPLMVLDAQHRIQRVNRAFTALTGYLPEEAVGHAFPLLHAEPGGAAYVQHRWEVLDATGFWQGEERIRPKDDEARIVHRTFSTVREPGGTVAYYVGSLHDETRERTALADLANLDQMVFSDRLTGLPNQDFLRSHLQQLLATAAAAPGVLLVADIDQFKRINELHGRAAGDSLLLRIARRLQQQQADCGLMARLGGDTFAWICTAAPGAGAAPCRCGELVAERLRLALRAPFELSNGVRVSITACVGWTDLASARGDADATLEAAELALQAAKTTGTNHTCRYSADMRARKDHRESLIHDLQAALVGEGLELYPQLQVDRTGRAVGAEALLRWTRPNGEQVPPDVLIPLAEQGRLLEALEAWVLDHACQLLAKWSTRPHLARLRLAANVTAQRFQQPGFVDALRARLARTGADPARLQLEITESAALGDFAAAAEKLRQLRALGIRISLDDFGTGYSSMTYLAQLPLDQLKIDQSFVAQVFQRSAPTVLIEAIIAMAHGCRLEVLAEGVETGAQKVFLQARGCDVFQGHLYARPMSVESFEARMSTIGDARWGVPAPDIPVAGYVGHGGVSGMEPAT
ncbi:MAG: putative bifunctional diguanylate cyclase/phosphodiesterase [Rhodanobacteraceae bacterium]